MQPEPLTDLEKAGAIKKLTELRRWSMLRAAHNLSISHKQIQNLLYLVEAPKEANKIKKLERICSCYKFRHKRALFKKSSLYKKLVEVKTHFLPQEI